jgi:hypothetical protein
MSEHTKDAAVEAPFVFGISGHRDLVQSDLPELRKQLQTVFERFRARYPNASFELLTPLAEGADRVAAEVALTCGIKLGVPMPLAQPEYERDFTTSESLAEFRRLLAKAGAHWEVSDDSTKPTSLSDSDIRAQKYAAVGEFIARKSHVLILLWDGRDNQKVGGTAWVKKRREHWIKSGAQEGAGPDIFGYAGTIQVVTPRATAGGTARPRIEIVGELPIAGRDQAEERSRL